jgi:hypothetical protein
VAWSRLSKLAVVAQLVEHFHGKEEVTGSIPVNGSMAPTLVGTRVDTEVVNRGRL